ncbi:MAG: hypothetical protein L3V56_08595 [Candidatus Magnetoovum sp. WYHC-5]|nr:hypothetical protein [Candidatus Magnetoovum sp. WYHC-5]
MKRQSNILILFLLIILLLIGSGYLYAENLPKVTISNSIAGDWRPFSDDSPWNTEISTEAQVHEDSDLIISAILNEATYIRFAEEYIIPVWVVDSSTITSVKVNGSNMFDRWDTNRDGWTDVGAPVTRQMWTEPTEDSHLCVIDLDKNMAWDFSAFKWQSTSKYPTTSTFNIWQLTSTGVGNPDAGFEWHAQGSRGSGFPLIAGLIRPEELNTGEIRHALIFTFTKNRRADSKGSIFLPPACRSDGKYTGNKYPIEGMRFQLDPSLTENDLTRLGLSREGKIVARALQKYGMFLGDNGGAMALQMQLLGATKTENKAKWESLFPGFYDNIQNIPVSKFRVIYTGEPIIKYD